MVAYFFRRRLRKVFKCCDHPKPEQEPKRQVIMKPDSDPAFYLIADPESLRTRIQKCGSLRIWIMLCFNRNCFTTNLDPGLTMRIRIQYFSSLRIRNLSGLGFKELMQCGSLGDYRSRFASTENVLNVPKDVAMHSIRISHEDPDPGEPNQGRYAWTRSNVTNFKIYLQ